MTEIGIYRCHVLSLFGSPARVDAVVHVSFLVSVVVVDYVLHIPKSRTCSIGREEEKNLDGKIWQILPWQRLIFTNSLPLYQSSHAHAKADTAVAWEFQNDPRQNAKTGSLRYGEMRGM